MERHDRDIGKLEGGTGAHDPRQAVVQGLISGRTVLWIEFSYAM